MTYFSFGGGSFGGGFPTTDPFSSQITFGGVVDQVGNGVEDALVSAASGAVESGVDALVSAITGQQQASTGSVGSVGVQAGNVQGIAALLAYMDTNTPPANNASQAERGNYVRYAVSAILGVPHDVVWLNNTTKTDAYNLFRSYLLVYDRITNGAYAFANAIPAPTGTCGSGPCSDSPYTFPADLYAKLKGIGSPGLKALDAAVTGQPLDSGTVTYLEQEAEQEGASATDALHRIWNNLIQTGTNILTGTVEGAAAGATATTTGAAGGSAAGRAGLFGIPVSLAAVLLVVAALFLYRKLG